jgi:hypothetical protein
MAARLHDVDPLLGRLANQPYTVGKTNSRFRIWFMKTIPLSTAMPDSLTSPGKECRWRRLEA